MIFPLIISVPVIAVFIYLLWYASGPRISSQLRFLGLFVISLFLMYASVEIVSNIAIAFLIVGFIIVLFLFCDFVIVGTKKELKKKKK